MKRSRTIGNDRERSGTASLTAWTAIGLWLLLYVWRALANHFALGTNAYDLSVFDYAIWNLTSSHPGFVPFFGHALFSEHFMPVLYLLRPLYWLFPTPTLLLVLQPAMAATAGLLFHRLLLKQRMKPWLATAMLLIFVFARRTHSAAVEYFYPEVLQGALTFAMVLFWNSGNWPVWLSVVGLLMTKEDAAIYVAGFALFALVTRLGPRRRTLAVFALSIVWFMVALLILIPASRRAEGLGASNPLLQARYGSGADGPTVRTVGEHLISRTTASTVVNLGLSTGFLPLAGPSWITPAVPGLLANLAASPDSGQSGLTGHYAWPVLPWLFLAAAAGATWLHGRWPRFATVWISLILAATLIDSPALQRMFTRKVDPEASVVRAQLERVSGNVILAQPNLIPHLPKTNTIFSVSSHWQPRSAPDLVVLTNVGNLWPLTAAEVTELVMKYRRDPRYLEVESGPLFAFKLKQ